MTSSQPSPNLASPSAANGSGANSEPQPYVGPTTDLMTRILSANELEQTGEHAEAVAKYQQVVDEDPIGVYGSIAQKALDDLGYTQPRSRPMTLPEMPIVIPESEVEEIEVEPVGLSSDRPNIAILQWFYDLSIRNKQLVFLGIFEVLVLILVGAGAWLIHQSLRNQLVTQSQSELTVAENTYNNQLAQLGAIAQTEALSQDVLSAARGVNSESLRGRLQALTREAQLDYAALVSPDLRVRVAANVDPGQTFDPDGLVSEVLNAPRQIRATVVQDPAELPTELGQSGEVLMRYVVSPLIDPNSQAILGTLVLGDLVNSDQPLMEQILQIFGTQVGNTSLRNFGGYSAIYLHQGGGALQLAVAAEQGEGLPAAGVTLPRNPRTQRLFDAALGDSRRQPQTTRLQIDNRSYTVAAKALPNKIIVNEMGGGVEVLAGEPPALLVRGTPEVTLDRLLFQTLATLLLVAVVVVILHILLALFLGRSITQPLQRLGEVARAFSLGDRQQRAEVITQDEVGELAQTFNEMADNILVSEAALEEQAQQRQRETEQQIQLRESLQQGVMDLLLEIEGAQHGDLTVQARVLGGEVGSIADAFNTTLGSLRQLVAQVKAVANRVNHLANSCEITADQLSPKALSQAAELNQALVVVEENATSIQRVAYSAEEAAEIARRGSELVKVGDRAIDQTVASMEKIRISAGDAAKQVKRLAESSQEISQIVGIITGIADKTNLLAFNASLEAARAGEHGQGFRQIADEVRRLATQVNDFAQEIEGLVGGIQQDTSEVIRGMEQNTSEVVTGTQWVNQTRATLQELVAINEQIDTSLRSVSEDTAAQTQASQQVTQTMAVVATGAQSTSQEAQGIVTSLRELGYEVQALRRSVARFQVNPEDETEIPEARL